MEATGIIYSLVDPRDGNLRYIGQTKAPLESRLAGHGRDKSNPRKREWFKVLESLGLKPQIKQLSKHPWWCLNQRESEAIAKASAQGANLLNLRSGGGCIGSSDKSEPDYDWMARAAARMEKWAARKGLSFEDWIETRAIRGTGQGRG